jgi:membrane protein YqaA with SNARE-associated domain
LEDWFRAALDWLSLPQFGLSTLFIWSIVSATVVPMGSEPVLFGLVKLNNDLFWPAIAVATVGNTIGGAISYWMGLGTHVAVDKYKGSAVNIKALEWLQKLGPKACFFAFLPAVGDPLCLIAGWLRMNFWQCIAWQAAGKCLRYIVMTSALLWVFPGVFEY